jgi:hypothetical protein
MFFVVGYAKEMHPAVRHEVYQIAMRQFAMRVRIREL